MLAAFAAIAVSQTAAPTDSLNDILAPNAGAERILTGFGFTEGPVWTRRGTLIFSDIPGNRLHEWRPGDAATSVYREPSRNANGNVLDRRGRLLTAEHSGRAIVRETKPGTVEMVAERFEGKRLSSPNDLTVRRNGDIYFTDPPFGLPRGTSPETPFNGVYRVTQDGTVQLVSRELTRPNGIVFSPNERTLYVNDSATRKIHAFDVARDGSTSNSRLFATLTGTAPGNADGMRVDKKGRLYTTGPGGIHVLRPDGTLVGVIPVPQAPTNLCWGERDAKTLYITAQSSVYRVRCRVAGIR